MISSTAAKVVAALAIVLTVVLAFVGYRISHQYVESSERANQAAAQAQAQAAPQTPKILAVVAVKPLAAYKPIAKDDVVLAEITVAPRDYYTSVEEVVGKEPLVDVDQGAPVTRRYFAEGNVLAKSIPPGFKAVSVEVSDVIGVGGFVRPGDTVDVLLYLRDTDDISATQARILLKDTRVLAYHELLVDRPEGLREGENNEARSSRRQRTAVLAVADADTTRLMLGASMGELRLALHGTMAVTPDASGAAPGALPMTETALREAAAAKVPDQAYTAAQLGRIELPPAKRQRINAERVIVYRGSDVQTITP